MKKKHPILVVIILLGLLFTGLIVGCENAEVTYTDFKNLYKNTMPTEELESIAKKEYEKYVLLNGEAKRLGWSKEEVELQNIEDVEEQESEWKEFIVENYAKALTENDVRQFYNEHQELYRKHDEVVGELSYWQDGIELSKQDLIIDHSNVKVVTEEFDGLTRILEFIQEGDGETWDTMNGTYYFICKSRKQGEVKLFEDVIEAATVHLAEHQYNQWIDNSLGSM